MAGRKTGATAVADAPTQYTLINTRRSACVYDKAGHSLGGGERLTVDGLDAVGQAAVDRGYLRARPVEPAPSSGQETGADAPSTVA